MSRDAAAPKPSRRKGTVSLASLVPDAVAQALRERGFASSAVMTEWREIVGPHLAAWTHPLEIRWPKRAQEAPAKASPAKPAVTKPLPVRTRTEQASRATLVIACPGAFALDMQMASAGIIEAVNRRLGFGCIGAIQIMQVPRPEPPKPRQSRNLDPAVVAKLETEFADIEAAELRQALARWGAEILTRPNR
jgi:hypothetical protein